MFDKKNRCITHMTYFEDMFSLLFFSILLYFRFFKCHFKPNFLMPKKHFKTSENPSDLHCFFYIPFCVITLND